MSENIPDYFHLFVMASKLRTKIHNQQQFFQKNLFLPKALVSKVM